MTVIVGVLLWPAKQTVRTWGKRQLTTHQAGEFMHGVGEVVVTIL